ncbi:hypothetical protein TNIN_477081 [Trichonephila inaurata madagascariensis]|uniref:Uncharacterized protein n=1 Tax=Trichonephila inaurata madagascariensis TaxID=2747483 RepID=A0A8X7CUG4_9ARAC|nr:hypothetical protein TNIN_477081 [Trichonephila inaurata madagascariensis]
MIKIKGSEQLLQVYTQLLNEGKLFENKGIADVLKKSIEETTKSKDAMVIKSINKKREGKQKESSDDFVFPIKTAKFDCPIANIELIETDNQFAQFEQDVEQQPPTNFKKTPKPKPLSPIMLKTKSNYREKFKIINEKCLDIKSKTSGEFIELYVNNDGERVWESYTCLGGGQ